MQRSRRRSARRRWRLRPPWGELGLVAVWVATSLSAGFLYRPYRDDWVLLGRAATWPHGSPWQFLLAHAYYGYRPLSFAADVEVWARFWPDVTIPWAIIMALMLVAVLMGRRLVERTTGSGFWVGAAVVLLFPAAVEGQYWIAASSGIVLSLLLLVLGAWAAYFALHAASGPPAHRWWVLAGAALLLSDMSYEQVWLPSLAVLAALAWRYRAPWLRTLLPALAALGATGTWYLLQSAALRANGKRGVQSAAQFLHEAGVVNPQLQTLWLHTVWQAFGQAWHGLTASPGLQVGAGWWLAVGLGTVLVAVAAARSRAASAPPAARMALALAALGAAWLVLSVVPWYLTTYGYVSARSATTTDVGVAFLAEAVVLLAAAARPWAGRAAAAALAVVMLVLGSSLRAQDVQAYQQSGRLDASLLLTTLQALHQEGIRGGPLVSYVGPYTWVPWDYHFGNHIESGFHANWVVQFGLEDLTQGRDAFVVQSANTGPPTAVPAGAVGIVVNTVPPAPSALALTHTGRGLVIQVSLAQGDPHIVQAAWYGAAAAGR